MAKRAQIELFGRAAVQSNWPSAPRNPVDTMPLLLNIETLAKGPVRLRGELSPEELDMETLDELVEDKGIIVLIESKALMHLIGSEMDYVEDRMKSGFVFSNPNEKSRCGCGESFNV